MAQLQFAARRNVATQVSPVVVAATVSVLRGGRDLPMVDEVTPVADAADDDQAPGWYGSSRDLRDGLEVREGLPFDLPLDTWGFASAQ